MHISQGRPFDKHNDNALQIFVSTGLSKPIMLGWRVLTRSTGSVSSSNVSIDTPHHHLVLVLMSQSQRPREEIPEHYISK